VPCREAFAQARLLPYKRAAASSGSGRTDRRGVQKNFPRALTAHLEGLPETTPVEIWFEDEARIGQKNGQVRQWARRGTRPRQPADQRYDNAYLFGAICPARGIGAALALPYADTECSSTSTKSRAPSPRALTPFCCSIGPDGTRPANSTCPTTSRRSSCLPALGAQPGRECLAISSPELALKHRVRK